MRPVVIAGDVWRVIWVAPDDPRLMDRTMTMRAATTDPITRTIHVSTNVVPPLLDKVILHEIAHAITVSYGLIYPLRDKIPLDLRVLVEEWAVELVERHAIEATVLASESLGRPLCIGGYCATTL